MHVDEFPFERPSLRFVPPCIKSEANPNRAEDLLMWTLGRVRRERRNAVLCGWIVTGAVSPLEGAEMALIAGEDLRDE